MSSKKRTSSSGLDSRSKELRSGSRSKIPSSSKLRMDSRPQQPRITDPSLPAGRRREIDTVMKKARSSPNSNGYWDKKLLEVEAKDPNRWRHSGYKAMYIGSSSRSGSRRSSGSRSRSSRSRSRSFVRQQHRERERDRGAVGPVPRSPRTPTSLSSCSDDSCSVCEPSSRNRLRRDSTRRPRERSRSYSVPSRSRVLLARDRERERERDRERDRERERERPRPRPASPPQDPRRPRAPPPPARPARAPQTSAQKPTTSHASQPTPGKKKPKDKIKEKEKPIAARIKTEQQRTKPKPRRRSPAESSGSDDSSSSTLSAVVASTRLTLSERFGKMAQWSVDRRDIENMRITKNSSSGDLKVMIEENRMYDSPPLRYSHSPAPIGHYPDELLLSGPSGMTAWDDVRVRYQYYKDLGYLRDLTLDDYVKWEQWWYKYQDWLNNERYYEHWLHSQSRRRRKRLPATQRLN